MIFYHVSSTQNRASILATGLELRLQENTNISRRAGVYLFETLNQALDYAYWDKHTYERVCDVWSVCLDNHYEVVSDTHPEIISLYNAWISYQAIPSQLLSLVEAQNYQPNFNVSLK